MAPKRIALLPVFLAVLIGNSRAAHLRSLKEQTEGLQWQIFEPENLHEKLTEHGFRRHLDEGEPNVRLSNSKVASLSQLASAETAFEVLKVGNTLPLPLPDGSVVDFVLHELEIMNPDLAAKFPNIKTFSAVSIGVDRYTANIDYNEYQGFHGQVFAPNGDRFYIDPFTRFESDLYTVYSQNANVGRIEGETDAESAGERGWSCANRLGEDGGATLFTGRRLASQMAYEEHHALKQEAPKLARFFEERKRKLQGGLDVPINSGNYTPRKYRLAVSANVEYSTYHGGATGGVAAVQAAIVTAVTRVTGIYKREFGVFLELVADNDKLTQLTAAATPRLLNSAAVIDQNQAFTDGLIGVANYDVGHAFSTGSGGLAGLGVFCAARKAEGTTGLGQPTGDAFYVDYVSHEIGHQIGMPHTFSGGQGACQGNMTPSHAFEPGSGTTIMGYAGICGTDNVQLNSDPYFHTISLYDAQYCMTDPTESCGQCGTPITAATAPYPTVKVSATVAQVPIGSKFRLAPEVADPNAIYSWDQLDAAPVAIPLQAPAQPGPIFRSVGPDPLSPERFIPPMSSVLANQPAPLGEKMPTAPMGIRFAVSARSAFDGVGNPGDNNGVDGFGNFNIAAVEADFVAVEPLTVGADLVPASMTAGETTTVNWSPGGTAALAPQVRVRMTINGGQSFEHTFGTADNTGTAQLAVPTTGCTEPNQVLTARVIVESPHTVGFYDIGTSDVTVNCPQEVPVQPADPNDPNSPAGTNAPGTGTAGSGDDIMMYAGIGGGVAALFVAGVIYNRRSSSSKSVHLNNPNAGMMAPGGLGKSPGQPAPGWRAAVDPSSGKTYYYNAAGQTTWTMPTM